MMRLKNNLGYTLVEIVTTTAIIGSLTAIAVPNFLRVKMNVNMEMVKQHMKVIGQEMNELYNQTREFPESLENILGGAYPEEFSLTASLNGIDNKGYTVDDSDYQLSAGRSNYSFTTCPKAGLENIAGDRCFVVDTMGVREMALAVNLPWDGTGTSMAIWWAHFGAGGNTNGPLSYLLNDSNHHTSQQEIIKYIADVLSLEAYLILEQRLTGGWGAVGSDELPPSILYQFTPDREGRMKDFLPKVYKELESRGITISMKSTQITNQDLANGLTPSGDVFWHHGRNAGGHLLYNPNDRPSQFISSGNYLQTSFSYNENIINDALSTPGQESLWQLITAMRAKLVDMS